MITGETIAKGLNRAAPFLLALAAACSPAAVGVATGGPLDRSLMPQPERTPEVDFPEVQRRTLSNGLELWIVERPRVPLVTVQLVLNAGAVTDPGGRAGLASLTAAMLREGTTTRTATQIAEEIDFLAATLNTGVGRETAVVSLSTLARNLTPAVALFADIVVNPAFRAEDWTRVRDQRLVALVQSRDQPGAVANEEFERVLFGPEHPYGRPIQGSPEAVGAITPAELREFHTARYRPGGANLIVVGDVDADALVRQLEATFGPWRGAAPPRVRTLDVPPPAPATRIYLIDKPGAAQSEIRIGHVSVVRTDPDYFPLILLNSVLGGVFSSRINLNLREEKGYTYGASSVFQMGRTLGSFLAGGGVQTNVTKESIIEFMRELEDVRGGRPATDEEVEFARTSTIREEPLTLETTAQIARRIQDLVVFDLPLDYFDYYSEQVAQVTTADVNRVAREHLRPTQFAIVVVGDRATIEQPIRTLPYPVEVVTLEGQP